MDNVPDFRSPMIGNARNQHVAAKDVIYRERVSSIYSTIALPLFGIGIGVAWSLFLPSSLSNDGKIADCFEKIFYVCWSLKSYPQFLLTYQRKTAAGFSIDAAFLNFFGYLTFLVYSFCTYNETIILGQESTKDSKVQVLQVYLLIHLVICSLITFIQMFVVDGYSRFRHGGKNRMNRKVHLIVSLYIFFNIMYLVLIYMNQTNVPGITVSVNEWLKSLSIFSAIFLLIRYIPQIWKNYRIARFEGISTSSVSLELAGAIALVVAIIYDGYQSSIFADDGTTARFGELVTALSRHISLSIVASCTVLADVMLLIQSRILAPPIVDHSLLRQSDVGVNLATRRPAVGYVPPAHAHHDNQPKPFVDETGFEYYDPRMFEDGGAPITVTQQQHMLFPPAAVPGFETYHPRMFEDHGEIHHNQQNHIRDYRPPPDHGYAVTPSAPPIQATGNKPYAAPSAPPRRASEDEDDELDLDILQRYT